MRRNYFRDVFFIVNGKFKSLTEDIFFWGGGGIQIMKYSVIFGFLTISNAFESPFWTWILVLHLSRGCLPVSLNYVKCRQYFRYEKLETFKPLKISVGQN